MKHFKDYALIILTAFVAVFCYRSCNDIKDIQVVETIVHDTITQKVVTSRWKQGNAIPYIVIATDTVHDSVRYTVHDTVQILTDYMRTYAYSDTINVDSNTFVISDTISQNKILGRGYGGHFVEKTIRIETTKIMPPKFAVYWGVLGDYRAYDKKVGFGFGLAFKMPKNGLFTLGATTNQYSIGIYKKL